jgi:hypothetical protein
MVDGHATSDVIFDEVDPPVGGLKTWPQLRKESPTIPDMTQKITILKNDLKKEIKATTKNITTRGVFGRLLQIARDTGTDLNIQAYPHAPYRSRGESYEVA